MPKKPTARLERVPNGAPYIAAKYYDDGMVLTGDWEVSIKIDGIRYIRNKDRVPMTRQGTPALPHVGYTMPDHMEDCELFRKDWSTSMSLKAGTMDVCSTDWYSLHPTDERLVLYPAAESPKHEWILKMLKWVLSQGHEGLVLKQGSKWVKVVPIRTVDVRVTGWVEGNGKNKGGIGSFTTNYGKVSCGTLTDVQRRTVWQSIQTNPSAFAGIIIEAVYREKTSGNKMRMARFSRFRTDKDTESFDLPYDMEALRV